MAKKALRSLQLPGLPDTYTVVPPEDVAIKADISDVIGVAMETDDHERRVAALEEETETLGEDLDDLAEELDSRADGLQEELESRTDALQQETDVKAEAIDAAGLALELDAHDRRMDGQDAVIAVKADAAQLASVAAETGKAHRRLDILEGTDQSAALGAVIVDVDVLQTGQTRLSNELGGIQSGIADLQAGKVPQPASSGTSGQVLSTDGDGGTEWIDPAAPTDEQIGEAVSDWLTEHPEATTTVEDGSITMAKLSGDVIAAIGTGEDADAQLLSEAIAVDTQARFSVRQEIAANVALFKRWSERLTDHAGRYLHSGFGFVFFTDPHNLTGRFYATPYSLIEDLRTVGTIWEHTPARYVFCGGDWLNSDHVSKQEAAMLVGRVQNLMRREICQDAWTVFGNHDDNSESGQGGTYYLNSAQIARMWYGTASAYFCLSGGDDLDIYLLDCNYGSQSISEYQWAELAWLAGRLLANTKTHLFGVGHMLYSEDSQLFGQTLCDLLDAFNRRSTVELNGVIYDFSSAAGTWHFLIGGHEHTDTTRTVSNIPIVVTDDFANGWIGDDYIRDKAIDLCYADWEDAVLYLDRVGKGESRALPMIPTGGYQTN